MKKSTFNTLLVGGGFFAQMLANEASACCMAFVIA